MYVGAITVTDITNQSRILTSLCIRVPVGIFDWTYTIHFGVACKSLQSTWTRVPELCLYIHGSPQISILPSDFTVQFWCQLEKETFHCRSRRYWNARSWLVLICEFFLYFLIIILWVIITFFIHMKLPPLCTGTYYLYYICF